MILVFFGILVFRLDIVLNVKVLLKCPVNKLSEQDLPSSVCVNLRKFSFQIFDRTDPLKEEFD